MSNSTGVGPGGYGRTARTGLQSRAMLLGFAMLFVLIVVVGFIGTVLLGWGPDLRVLRPPWLGSDREPGIYERILEPPPPLPGSSGGGR